MLYGGFLISANHHFDSTTGTTSHVSTQPNEGNFIRIVAGAIAILPLRWGRAKATFTPFPNSLSDARKLCQQKEYNLILVSNPVRMRKSNE